MKSELQQSRLMVATLVGLIESCLSIKERAEAIRFWPAVVRTPESELQCTAVEKQKSSDCHN